MASLVDLRNRKSGYVGTKPHQVRFRDATDKQRAEQYTTKKDAERRLREVQTAEETGRVDLLDAGTATLVEVGRDFFALHKNEWKKNTAQGHAYVWNAAVEGEKYPRAALADMPVRNIRKSHVTTWRNDALDAGVPVSSVRRALSLIVRTLDYACNEDLIAANPAARVKPPSEDERPKPSIIPPEHVEAIRAHLNDREAAFVSIMAYCALRPHEARALEASQFGGSELHLEQACAPDGSLQPLKSGHDMRDTPICDAVADDVAALDLKKGLLLPNVYGETWTKVDYDNWRKRRFKKAVEKANAKIVEDTEKTNADLDDGEQTEPVLIPADLNPYDLRASACSLWYRQGIDKATIAARAGHSIAVLERHYAAHFKTLDPLDKRTMDEMIADARKPPEDDEQ